MTLSFRPLSRYIGLYHFSNWIKKGYLVLPSPLEVNRFTSEQKDTGEEKCNEFPSPREADRFISCFGTTL